MYLTETLKRTFEKATGRGRPTARQARAAVEKVEPKTFRFKDDGAIPNNPDLPAVVYAQAVRLDHAADPAAVLEELFKANQWGESWRNGIYDYHHYHSTAHEVLGIYSGSASVQFGAEGGIVQKVHVGDVIVIPAGVAHKNLGASEDFGVVGAYPEGQQWDLLRGKPGEREKAEANIKRVLLPKRDPVQGEGGVLLRLWN